MAEGRFTNPVIASLAGVKDFFSSQELSSRYSDKDRAEGKTVLITGANSGLGFALAVEFARRGARVIMAGRSRIPEAGNQVAKKSGSGLVEMRYLDLSKLETIHQFVQTLASEGITPGYLYSECGHCPARIKDDRKWSGRNVPGQLPIQCVAIPAAD